MIIFEPHPGPQTRLMAFKGRYALYGGSANSGKSEVLLHDPFRQIKIEQARVNSGEISESTGRCIYFRRTMPELREMIDRAHRKFPLIDPGAVWHEQTKTWTFSCGYKYMFGQMEEPGDWMKYYGFEFTECVEVGTLVRMADGSLWPIEKIRPGDMVLTLEGPCAVSAVSKPRSKQCVRADVYLGHGVFSSQVHPVDHPVLTIVPTSRSDQGSSILTFSTAGPTALSWLSYESLSYGGQENPAHSALSATGGIGSAVSGGSRPAAWRPEALTVPVVLHVPKPHSVAQYSGADRSLSIPSRDAAYAQQSTQTPADFRAGYRAADDFHGGQLLHGGSAGQASFLQQGCAEGHARYDSLASAQQLAQERTRLDLNTYVHPYTGEERPVSADLAGDLAYGSCTMTPVGLRDVIDVSIAGARHYITASGLINRNCIFDELTTFTEEQFEQMDTRLRSADPVLRNMLYLRAGTNPVGAGRDWVRRRFVECAPPNTPVIRRVEVPVFKDGVRIGAETVEHTQIFIPARVSDNLSADQVQYTATLMTKSATVRKQLLEGDWYAGGEGAWVEDIWEPAIHVCDPFKIPAGWPKFRTCDYGFSWPGLSSVQWFAVDTDSNFVGYRSFTTVKHNASMLAHRVKEIEVEAGEWDMNRGCSKLTGPLDNSCWNNMGNTGPTIAESFFEVGVFWYKSEKDRHAAAEQMRQRLMRRTAHPTLKDKDKKPVYCIPGIRWFNTCYSYVKNPRGNKVKVGPIVTIPVLPKDENDPDVPDTKGNDHDYDSAAMGCLSRPLTALDDKIPRDELAERKRQMEKSQQAKPGRMGYPGAW